MAEIRVWDPLVRVFHWSLVAAFTAAYLSGDEWESLHVYAGYTILGLVLFRVIWGFIGTRHARFSDFVYRPAAIKAYLKDLFAFRPKHFLGHNPAGGLMVVMLLVSLLFTTLTGLSAYGADGEGLLAGWIPEQGEHLFEEVHEFFANFTLALVFIHVGGVVVSSFLHGENLVRAMVTGRKSVE